MISGIMAEETSSGKEVVSTSKVVTINEITLPVILSKLKLKTATIRMIKNWLLHLQQVMLIIALNTIFNVAWEETYDYLFGIYGMTPIPYFPIP
ncbi:hypothetical protein CAJAP_05024 [Camponotus japonicus]